MARRISGGARVNHAGGYARLWRGVYGHAVLRDVAEESAFAWLVGRAAWQPVRVKFRGKPIHLKRGQLAVSQRELARGLRWSLGTLQRFLNRLTTESMIDTATESGVTVITICNYSLYQDAAGPGESVGGSGDETKPSQSRVTEQRKEEKKDSPPTPPRGKPALERTYLPAEWKPPPIADLPPQALELAQQWPAGSYEREAESFALYWRSERKLKADWRATWANWIHRADEKIMRQLRFAAGRAAGTDARPLWEQKAAQRRAKEGQDLTLPLTGKS